MDYGNLYNHNERDKSRLCFLDCTPPPQDTLRVEHLDQFPHGSFTGKGLIEHLGVSTLVPTQSAPPFAGAGLLDFLVWFWISPPHKWEHFE